MLYLLFLVAEGTLTAVFGLCEGLVNQLDRLFNSHELVDDVESVQVCRLAQGSASPEPELLFPA